MNNTTSNWPSPFLRLEIKCIKFVNGKQTMGRRAMNRQKNKRTNERTCFVGFDKTYVEFNFCVRPTHSKRTNIFLLILPNRFLFLLLHFWHNDISLETCAIEWNRTSAHRRYATFHLQLFVPLGVFVFVCVCILQTELMLKVFSCFLKAENDKVKAMDKRTAKTQRRKWKDDSKKA